MLEARDSDAAAAACDAAAATASASASTALSKALAAIAFASLRNVGSAPRNASPLVAKSAAR
jgi:hypothetical protein